MINLLRALTFRDQPPIVKMSNFKTREEAAEHLELKASEFMNRATPIREWTQAIAEQVSTAMRIAASEIREGRNHGEEEMNLPVMGPAKFVWQLDVGESSGTTAKAKIRRHQKVPA